MNCGNKRSRYDWASKMIKVCNVIYLFDPLFLLFAPPSPSLLSHLFLESKSIYDRTFELGLFILSTESFIEDVNRFDEVLIYWLLSQWFVVLNCEGVLQLYSLIWLSILNYFCMRLGIVCCFCVCVCVVFKLADSPRPTKTKCLLNYSFSFSNNN